MAYITAFSASTFTPWSKLPHGLAQMKGAALLAFQNAADPTPVLARRLGSRGNVCTVLGLFPATGAIPVFPNGLSTFEGALW